VSRRYLEPVQVRTCTSESDSEPTTEFDAQARPRDFLWRGRRYVVRTVVAHWIEGGSWWRRPERSGERQLWRVEAECHRSTALGVYDLSCDPMVSQWHLVRALD